jgi:hypothetical protein
VAGMVEAEPMDPVLEDMTTVLAASLPVAFSCSAAAFSSLDEKSDAKRE